MIIVATGVFSIIFMNLYTPFDSDSWIQMQGVPLFVILSSYGILGMVMFFFSQIVIRNLLNVRTFTRLTYGIWFAGEVLLLSLIMFLVYGDYNQLSLSGLMSEYFLALRYTVLVLIIPYGAVMFYFQYLKEKESKYTGAVPGDHLVKINDENDILQLAIDLEKLLFIQSTDNYVSVFFLKDERVIKELVRTSLKKLEKELKDTPIVRCHRSYMVNLNKILITKKTGKGLMLELQHYPGEQIKVSRHYRAAILKLLQKS